MNLQQQIESKIRQVLKPVHLEVVNESGLHAVPPASETHFKVIVVSEAFQGKSLLERHRAVNGLLEEARQQGLHALALQTLTPEEWNKKAGQTPASPLCRVGTSK